MSEIPDLDQTQYIAKKIYDDPHTPHIPLDLHSAAALGNYECVQDAINSGKDIDAHNKAGWTPLMYASYVGHDTVVNLLLDSGADSKKGTPDGLTPLMVAAGCGNESVCYFLLQTGAEIDVQDCHGFSALCHAVRQGHQTVVQLLLEHEANMELREHDNRRTGLMLAAQEGDEIIVDILIACGADISAQDKEGHTARSLAFKNDHVRTVTLLDSAVYMWQEETDTPTPVAEEDGDLFSGPKELEAYQHSVEVKRAIQTRLGYRGGARWSLPPETIAQQLRGGASSAPISILKKKKLRTAFSMPEQELPPTIPEETTLEVVKEVKNEKLYEFLTDLGLEKYAEVFERQEIDFESLRGFADEDLKRIGITLLGPRRKISNALTGIRELEQAGSAQSKGGRKASRPKLVKQPSTELQQAYERAVETIDYLEGQLSQEHQLRQSADSYLLELQQSRQKAVSSVSSIFESQRDIDKHCTAVRSTHNNLTTQMDTLRMLASSAAVDPNHIHGLYSEMVSLTSRLGMEMEALERSVDNSRQVVESLGFQLKSL